MKIFTKTLILFSLIFLSFAVQAQKTGNVTGRIIGSKDKKPVDYATVILRMIGKDSSVVGSSITPPTGIFEIKGMDAGTYKLVVAFIGFNNYTKNIVIPADKSNVNLGDIVLEDGGVNIQSVEVTQAAPPIRVKKDTLEFNASSFKVKENAVVEDVLKKLPGVDVAKDGTITAQGETIKKVRVDGKDFMGNDPLLATRNLPADMIDKIQIIDDLSDQSKFSGVDDGNREKIINITTRQDKKNGYFGNSSVGYGTDDRYDANINVNKFDNNQQFSFIGQFNNVNKQNFGGGGGGNFGGGGGVRVQLGAAGGGSSGGGITTTNAAGFNFADVYSDQTLFNGSIFYNKTSVLNISNSFTQNIFATGNSLVNNAARSTSDRENIRANFTIDTKLDSTTSIRLQPNVSYSQTDGFSSNIYNRQVLTTNTNGNQQYNTSNDAPSFSNNLLIRKKFQRRGRTLSLNVNTNINNNDAANFNIIRDVVSLGSGTVINNTNQLNDGDSRSLSNSARLVFTEPLSKTLNLELNYTNNYSYDNNDKFVYNFNPATGEYDIVDVIFTNQFKNANLSNTLGFSFNKTEKKYNWNIGLGVQNTDRSQTNITTGGKFSQNFYNLTPSAQYRYTFSQNKRLEFNYRGNTQQPSISQIQPIPDNTNTQTVLLGNPNLRPSFGNTLRIQYRNFNFTTFRNLFINGTFNQTFNDIASTRDLISDPANVNFGKFVSSYRNVSGNYNAFVVLNVGQPIVAGNKLSLNLGGGGGLTRTTAFVSGLENIAHISTASGSLRLTSNLDKLDLNGGVSFSYQHTAYSAQEAINPNRYVLTPNIDISYLFPGNIRLQMDVFYNRVTGQGAGFNTEYTLVNSFISRQFFKNRGTFKIQATDLLNQNTGISRTNEATYIQDMTYNVLKRYYMFSFTYSLNRVAGRTMGAGQGAGQPVRMGGQRMGF